MKPQTKALLVSFVVLAVALSAVSGITYSWFSDTEETTIDVTTGTVDASTSDFYVKHGVTSLYSGTASSSAPASISVVYDDKRDTSTAYAIGTNTLSIAGDPDDVGVEIGYTVKFTWTVDYRYMVQVDDPDHLGFGVSISKVEGTTTTDASAILGEWQYDETYSVNSSGSATYKVVISIDSVPSGLNGSDITIANRITQYLANVVYVSQTNSGDGSGSSASNTMAFESLFGHAKLDSSTNPLCLKPDYEGRIIMVVGSISVSQETLLLVHDSVRFEGYKDSSSSTDPSLNGYYFRLQSKQVEDYWTTDQNSKSTLPANPGFDFGIYGLTLNGSTTSGETSNASGLVKVQSSADDVDIRIVGSTLKMNGTGSGRTLVEAYQGSLIVRNSTFEYSGTYTSGTQYRAISTSSGTGYVEITGSTFSGFNRMANIDNADRVLTGSNTIAMADDGSTKIVVYQIAHMTEADVIFGADTSCTITSTTSGGTARSFGDENVYLATVHDEDNSFRSLSTAVGLLTFLGKSSGTVTSTIDGTMSVLDDKKVVIKSGAVLDIAKGATLDIAGKTTTVEGYQNIVVENGGLLQVDGAVTSTDTARISAYSKDSVSTGIAGYGTMNGV